MNIYNLIVSLSNKRLVMGTELFLLLGGTPMILLAGLTVMLKGTYIPLAVLALLPIIKNSSVLLAVGLKDLSLKQLGLIMIFVRVISLVASCVAFMDREIYLYMGIVLGVLAYSLEPIFRIRYTSIVVKLHSEDGYHEILTGVTTLKSVYKLIFGLIAAGLYLIDVNYVILVSLLINMVAVGWGVVMYRGYWSKYS